MLDDIIKVIKYCWSKNKPLPDEVANNGRQFY